MGEGEAIASAVDRVLRLSVLAGDPQAFRQGQAVLAHLLGLSEAHVDTEARQLLRSVQARWLDKSNHAIAAADPVNILSPQPVDGRRARIVATINPKADVSTLVSMIENGDLISEV